MATIEIDGRIRDLLALHLDLGRDELTPQSRLMEDLCVDSLTAVEVLMILEDEFDISLPEHEVGELHTFADLVNAVELAARA